MKSRRKLRESFIIEEKEREEKAENLHEVDMLIEKALRRAEDGKLKRKRGYLLVNAVGI